MSDTYEVKPTEKQVKAIHAIVAGEANVGKAMRDAGYSAKSSENPKQNLMDRRGVHEYLDTLDAKAQRLFHMSALDKALDVYLKALQAESDGVPDHKVRLMAADRLVAILLAAKQRETEATDKNALSYTFEERQSFNDKFRDFLRYQQYHPTNDGKAEAQLPVSKN